MRAATDACPLLGLGRAVASLDEGPQHLVPVVRLLDGVGRVDADGDLLALAVQVVLVAPCLGPGGQDFEQKAATIGRPIGTVARLRVDDRDRLEQTVGVPYFSSPGGSHGLTFGPVMLGSQGINREVLGLQKQKTPIESTIWGSAWNWMGRPETS